MTSTTKLLTRGLLLGVSLLAAAAFADPDLEGRVDGYLGSLDSVVTPEQWKALGPAAVAVLESRAFSADQLPSVRARASEALGIVGTPAHGQRLATVAADEKAPLPVRLSALRSAGKLLSPDDARPVLTRLLQHDTNLNVRSTAGDVLSRQPGKAGCALVQKQVRAEKTVTQRVFSPALKRCQSPPQ